jgi:hypothetical protein
MQDAQKTFPTSSNPNDYSYAVKVEDEQVLLLKEEMDEKSRLCRRLQSQLDIARAEQSALRDRIFLRLEEVYPGVWSLNPESGVGIREWQNNLWYVAWDPGNE